MHEVGADTDFLYIVLFWSIHDSMENQSFNIDQFDNCISSLDLPSMSNFCREGQSTQKR